MKGYQKKNKQADIFEIFPQAINALKKNLLHPLFDINSQNASTDQSPLRSELFTDEQLKKHARMLAKKHIEVAEGHSEHLLKRLSDNESILLDVYEVLTETVKQKARVAPAGEWLLDNFYLIEEQIYTGKKHLPKGYSKGLPQILSGKSAGLPRVYDIAVEIISHSDGFINMESLLGFIEEYQKINFLKIGELWAIPIMFRLGLLENLRRLATQISIDINNKSIATSWADKMVSTLEKDPKNLVIVLADMAKSNPPMVSSFVAELIRRLQEKGNSLTLAVNWIEQTLAEMGITSSDLILQENQKQAADQVSISNSISSLRFLGTTDWREFVEKTSIVEKILQEDINGVYGKMDFSTRDSYRHVVERIAKKSKLTEQQVAEIVIQLAKEQPQQEHNLRLSHVGYYLVDKGSVKTRQLTKMKLPLLERCKNIFNTFPLLIYVGAVIMLSFFVAWNFIINIYADNLTTGISLFLFALLFIASSQLAVSIINWCGTQLTKPSLLSRMDFSKGIPEQFRTMIVIPTILTSIQTIDDIIEGLEVRYLANRDANLHFALLTDFKDADKESLPDDEMILHAAQNKIIELNKKYNNAIDNSFFLFHRPRKWNAKEKVWMGHERKRGKLGELNELILHGKKDNFSLIVGDEKIITSIKYIITLDTDTQLPRDTAYKMTGTMAHPLNHPYYCDKKGCVIEGYTILQPRVSNSLPGIDSSIYKKIHGNEPGTDPYTRAVSDLYQDLFNEGSFIGKGIYEVKTFEQVLKNKFPENRILSHDLLEGCYTRSGLITDVQLYEEYPSRYDTDMKRRHRWIRGDWQIARWIMPRVPGNNKKNYKNPISALSIWKLFDNLRRSIIPICFLLLFLAAWIIPLFPLILTVSLVALFFVPAIISFFWELCHKPVDVKFFQHFIFSITSLSHQFIHPLLSVIFLPYEAILNSDAILRTLWRVFVSKKNLLQWQPYRNGYTKKSIIHAYAEMWFAPLFSALALLYLIIFSSPALIAALPLIAVWFISPLIAWWVSRPAIPAQQYVLTDQKIYLRKISRKIWAFFENFVVEKDNWLPPDNYQETPVERIAHRTSPTNIGLYLLSNLTAYDFGYITTGQLIERTTNTINTLQSMERYRGHFYNWYDTISLVPLHPKYISTVDSGNLAGHLLTLKQGLLTIPDKKIISNNVFEGFLDAFRIIADEIENPSLLNDLINQLQEISELELNNLGEIKYHIETIQSSFASIYTQLNVMPGSKAEWWVQKITTQIIVVREELVLLIPWLLMEVSPKKFEHLIPELPAVPTIRQLSKIEQILLHKIIDCYAADNTAEENEWLTIFRSVITEAGHRAKELLLTAEQLAIRCASLADMEYDFLYDKTQHLLSIGYNVDEHRRDNSFYDLLASEARLSTFVGIAQGKLPQESWFALGKQITSSGGKTLLISWSGSMFEYLMPLLVMPSYNNTLLDETHKGIVQKQIDYGMKRGIPWGISESGYNLVDANLNYQYRAFGIPGAGFKRGLADDLVIAPYATIMALMVAPAEAFENLELLKQLGFEGDYGFFEAIDYTPSRLSPRQNHAVIKSFMSHHQGMSFLSISYLLLDQPMQKRFEADVQIKSALLLLQEKIPRISSFYLPVIHAADINTSMGENVPMRVINTPHTPIPELQLLSNGRYHVMVTNTGGGYSRWKNIAVNRWREDVTCDNWGMFCYIRDLDSNLSWSSSFQPSLQQGDNYEAVFTEGRAEFRRRDFAIETHTEIVVSPEDDIELRRVRITNRSRKKRTIEITSYAEVVLASSMSDEAHPAFSNLFVQTDVNTQRNAITCTRRPRSAEEQVPWMFHLMKVHDAEIIEISYETDRSAFIGRGSTIHNPKIINQPDSLSNKYGSVLDPIVAIQYRITIEPQQSATIDMIFGIAETKEICNGLIQKYQDRHLINRVLELAWTHSQVILRQINAIETDAQLYTRLASSILFANASLRAEPGTIIKNHRGQAGLWSYSISGDLPIVLLQIEDATNISLVKQLIQAHSYWRLKGLAVDLVIWNEDHGGYRQDLHNDILSLIAQGIPADIKDKPGSIFIRSADQISNEDRILFQTVAHAIISDRFGKLEDQVGTQNKLKPIIPYFKPTKFHTSVNTSIATENDLQFYNGIGGFSKDGKEYVITTTPDIVTPAPWINVLANPNFGTIISESGQSYTWIENAHELRLTPWNNDPVTDLKGEAFYLRDEESGKFWSPSPLPCRGNSPYTTRHGFGYSIFEHSEDGIQSEMCVYVDTEAPVKFIVIKVKNNSNRPRRLSATGYIEWVLGDLRLKYAMHIITEVDRNSGAIIARNHYNPEFENRVAFFDTDEPGKTYTGDRTEFIGRNGTLGNPEAMNRAKLSGKTGPALDPCTAMQVSFELLEEEEREIIFRLGAGKGMSETTELINNFKGSEKAQDVLNNVNNFWKATLGVIQIQTPDAAVNILANGWLNYQTLACRIWARSGFYQSGGAFGFRDQLQDMLSLIYTQPKLVRQQILLCASRQFNEGDVQHWWHPPVGRGVRTTCSDDFLWLPFVTHKYIIATGDTAILDEKISFIEGRLLNAGEDSYYDLPIRSDNVASLYEHCIKAVNHALQFGEHGLPFIGSGDWNDGMDKVGNHGKGESVWLAFFLHDILVSFSAVAIIKKDDAFANKCISNADKLKININKNTWDGKWYRRAYFDDGTPLGSAQNDECKIDSIAQSWSVLSKAGEDDRAYTAMQSAYENLVRKDEGIIQLFNPPFDVSAMNPGYIKGYVPGVRENGGQYTHAAIWLVMAFAAMGNKEKTWELLQMINPINHGSDKEKIEQYKVEPYVIAADVYATPLHKGRGGWTWYTGSAGWMYQLIVQSFAGFIKEGNTLRFAPCLPADWPSMKIIYQYQDTTYDILLEQIPAAGGEAMKVFIDNVEEKEKIVLLINDKQLHTIKVVMEV